MTKEAIQEAYADNGTNVEIPDFGDHDDVPQVVARALYEVDPTKIWDDLDDSQKKRKESRVKKLLNTQAVSKMTVERMEQNNGKDDLELWLKALNEIE